MWRQTKGGFARQTKNQLAAVLLVLLLLEAAAGQNTASSAEPADGDSKQKNTENAKLDSELQAVVDQVDGVAPEFGADALMRVVESGKVANRVTKIALLERAFDLAAEAEQPVKRGGVYGNLDSRDRMLFYAFNLNLDKLSLQSRSLDNLLLIDAAEARRRFEEIEFPILDPIPCEQALTYDIGALYETAAKIVRNLTAKQKAEGRQLALLMPYMTLQSHAQIKPAADLLANTDLPSAELESLAAAFALSLSQLKGDERSFAIITADSDAIADVVGKAIRVLEGNAISGASLLQALRQYLVSNFGGLVCNDAGGDLGWIPVGDRWPKSEQKNPLPSEVEYFNQHFRTKLQRLQIPL